MELSLGNRTMPTQRNRITYLSAVAALMTVAGVAYWTSPSSAESARRIPTAAVDERLEHRAKLRSSQAAAFGGCKAFFSTLTG